MWKVSGNLLEIWFVGFVVMLQNQAVFLRELWSRRKYVNVIGYVCITFVRQWWLRHDCLITDWLAVCVYYSVLYVGEWIGCYVCCMRQQCVCEAASSVYQHLGSQYVNTHRRRRIAPNYAQGAAETLYSHRYWLIIISCTSHCLFAFSCVFKISV